MGPYAEGSARMLAEGPRRFEPMEFTGANTEPGDHYVHEEDEFLTVLEGSIVISLGPFGERRPSRSATRCTADRAHPTAGTRPAVRRTDC